MKILLLGANGQLGRGFLIHGGLGARGELSPASRDGNLHGGGPALVADLSQPEAIESLLDAERPQVIVNTAAYTAVDKAEQEENLATLVNGHALSVIGGWAARHGALVVHYSTDYVFDGQASVPYAEDAWTSPSGAYGRSKLAGEHALRASGAAHFIFRTAWVYSAIGQNFLRTMLRLGADRDELRVVADQRGTPTDTGFIIDATLAALDRWMVADAGAKKALLGLYHLTTAGDTTWHGFAQQLLARATDLGLLDRSPRVVPITTAEFPTPAKRPAYSVLDTSRLSRTFDIDIPTWQSGVDRVLATLSEPE